MTAFNKAWIILKQLGQDDLSEKLPPYNPLQEQEAGPPYKQPPWPGDPNPNAPPPTPFCKLCRKNPLISYSEQYTGICMTCRRKQKEYEDFIRQRQRQNPEWNVHQPIDPTQYDPKQYEKNE